jgi:hypothetical protein
VQILRNIVCVLIFTASYAVCGSETLNLPKVVSTFPAEGNAMRMRTIEQITSTPCTHLKRVDSGLVKIVIDAPGHYCLTESLHARIEFADHAAERQLIVIYTGDVVLDLQGHTLGRGRIFRNPGGYGIRIVDPENFLGGVGLANNIVIKNGILQDFDIGILLAGRWQTDQPDTPTVNPKTNTYHFPANNITLEEITFKRNKADFEIHVPPPPGK